MRLTADSIGYQRIDHTQVQGGGRCSTISKVARVMHAPLESVTKLSRHRESFNRNWIYQTDFKAVLAMRSNSCYLAKRIKLLSFLERDCLSLW